jgi:hypothetical protein
LGVCRRRLIRRIEWRKRSTHHHRKAAWRQVIIARVAKNVAWRNGDK